MEYFTSYDGTTLAYRVLDGGGPPLICVPGGPGRAAAYLGDLGGLDAHRTLVLPDTRGTGFSAMPADPTTCRVDRLVADVEALRRHLGLDTIDLLGHSAGAGVALLYAGAHPERLHSLVLATPSFAAIGLPSDTGAEEVLASRAAEPWYAQALSAYRSVKAARSFAEAAPHRPAFEPLMYGRWDAAATAHAAADPVQRSLPVSEAFYDGYIPDPVALHARLAALRVPVLILAGERDLWPTAASAPRAAALFPDARVVVQADGGHYPWLDDPTAFASAVAGFLAAAATRL
ncbi:alpha/beta hydrolase [Streptomyces sp. NPDC091204]|uniref:alpha/beta fold hydrolase n=1 Tax=Streptomyces sp. NPDC091204 TaxID=3155299 RepID=UPI0034211AA7